MDPTTQNSHTHRLAMLVALAFIACGCSSLKTTAPDVDPFAREQISRMQSAMEHIGTYRMTIETLADEALPSGQLVQVEQTTVIQMERPNHFSVSAEDDAGNKWSVWYSGGKITLLDETQGRYTRLDLTPPLDKALDELAERYGLELPLLDVVSGLRRVELLGGVQAGIYVGTETIAGRECHHVLFRQPVADWQMWIEKDNPALPRKLLLVFHDEPGQPIYQATIEKWDLEPKLKKSDWKPKLPKTAREVSIDELLGQEEAP